MKRDWLALLIVAGMVCGCDTAQQPAGQGTEASSTSPPASLSNNSPPAAADDRVIATVRGHDIRMSELEGPLVESYGLSVLLELVQLDLVEQDAKHEGVVASDQDAEDEGSRTLVDFRKALREQDPGAVTQPIDDTSDYPLTPAERDKLLTELLTSQHLTKTEFNIAMRRNAMIRKIVTPQVQAEITDTMVHDRFNTIYGEKARVSMIRFPDMMSVAQAEREMQGGESFEAEIAAHHLDAGGQLNAGEVPLFGRKDEYPPTEFRMVAFGLKPGQVSDPLQLKESIYLIKLLELIPPQHANFDEYKDDVKRDLTEAMIQDGIRKYIQNLGTTARENIEVKDPVLNEQWQQTLRSASELRDQLLQQQKAATTQPAPSAADSATTAPAN